MRQLKQAALLAGSIMLSPAYAGEMGEALPDKTRNATIFTALEGSYSWDGAKTPFEASRPDDPITRHYGGRVSIGMFQHYYNDSFIMSIEGGWGSYATTIYNQYRGELGNFSASSKAYGFDLLVGLWKPVEKIDFFVKAGAMLETLRQSYTKAIRLGLPDESIVTSYTLLDGKSVVVPEVKGGIIYNVTKQLGISLSCLYVAGWDVEESLSDLASPTNRVRSATVSLGPPPFVSAMLGIQYSFL
ncbi:MAG: hypothetical protein P1U32_04710 [Legionellaceae bacterium]|nr:hypothetical protein [Legionellaceae bacterium]